ncbi:MAG: hypothetical protein ACO3JL_16090, partial [Myxococcota bacterium]
PALGETEFGPTEFDYYAGNLEVTDGALRGDIGPVRNIDTQASRLSGYQDDWYASVEVRARTDGGAAMSLVNIHGGLDALQPGMRRTFRAGDYPSGASDELFVDVMNCSGNVEDAWDYDVAADEVTVEVSEGSTPDTLRVDYTTRTAEHDPFLGLPTGSVTEAGGHFEVVR